MAKDPAYLKVVPIGGVFYPAVADIESGFQVAGREIAKWPTEDYQQEAARVLLRNGRLEEATAAEWEEQEERHDESRKEFMQALDRKDPFYVAKLEEAHDRLRQQVERQAQANERNYGFRTNAPPEDLEHIGDQTLIEVPDDEEPVMKTALPAGTARIRPDRGKKLARARTPASDEAEDEETPRQKRAKATT